MALQQLQKAAVVIRENGSFRFEIRQTPIPSIQPWEILVKLSATSICGTDIAMAAGYVGPTCDILGHEGVGRVVRIGSGVDPSTVKVGDRIGIAWLRDICGNCPCCAVPGGEVRCVEQLNSGRKHDGTLQEYCTVPNRYVLKLPDELNIPDPVIAPILCAGVTAYSALKAGAAVPGEWAAISGAGGGVGALGIQYAKAMGYRVIAIDVGPTKEGFCLEQGAEVYCDALDTNLKDTVRGFTSGAMAKAVVVCAGSGAAYRSAFDLVAYFGTIVCVGIPPPDELISAHPLQLIDNGIRLIGSAVGTRTDTLEALEFVRRGMVNPAIHLSTLDDLNDISGKVASTIGKYVIQFEKFSGEHEQE
ncbi:alcohol dehydrogenase [Pseudomassariella vexata]|uniref:alcohol dehydrogenase n=1 Tax=Pseudomassariella vexata TaxID=1141098 RepID=A0A1Y2E6X3_9PEZI|nr:alcohol dehydrogenase [Pseudomassariella vexata]ORY67187.1 alcohol dehydrogenase [Pseudomassariella vexata]